MNVNDRLIVKQLQALGAYQCSSFLVRNLNLLTHRIKLVRFFVASVLPKPFSERMTLNKLVIDFIKLGVLKVLAEIVKLELTLFKSHHKITFDVS
jgi:hypothetical protein